MMTETTQGQNRQAGSQPDEEDVQRPTKIAKLDFLYTTKFLVRNEKEPKDHVFLIPTDLILRRSKLMAKRAQNGTLDHPFSSTKWEAESFSRYLQLLFTGQILVSYGQDPTTMNNQWKYVYGPHTITTDLEDVISTNQVRDTMVHMLHSGLFNTYPIRVAYADNVPRNDIRRRILIDFVADTMETGTLPPNLHNSREGGRFLYDAIAELLKRRDSDGKRVKQMTADGMKKYHEPLD